MKKNNLNIEDIMDANSLEGAINGLSLFIFHTISGGDIKSEDISSLNGLVASIQLLAKTHADNLSAYKTEI